MDFAILDQGRTAAFNAGVSGIKIEVTNFVLGSAFGYIPDPVVDTGLRGTELFRGVPTGFAIIEQDGEDGDTCEYILEVNADAGTFDFGEVALILNNGIVFALASLPRLQQKIARPGRGWNTIRIRARIQLVNLIPVIQWHVQYLTVGVLQELPNWSLVQRPNVAPANAYIIHDSDEYGNDSFITRNADNTWDVSTHTYPVVKRGTFSILPGALSTQLVANGPLPIENDFPIGRYLIQITSGPRQGLVRQLIAASGSMVQWTPGLGSALEPTDQFEILQSTLSVVETEGSEIAFFHALSVRSVQ